MAETQHPERRLRHPPATRCQLGTFQLGLTQSLYPEEDYAQAFVGSRRSEYGYSLTLPPAWHVVPASIPWDGITDPGHLEPTVDQMRGPSVAVAWAFAAPVTVRMRHFSSWWFGLRRTVIIGSHP